MDEIEVAKDRPYKRIDDRELKFDPSESAGSPGNPVPHIPDHRRTTARCWDGRPAAQPMVDHFERLICFSAPKVRSTVQNQHAVRARREELAELARARPVALDSPEVRATADTVLIKRTNRFCRS